jgi:hypothetical protein
MARTKGGQKATVGRKLQGMKGMKGAKATQTMTRPDSSPWRMGVHALAAAAA